jgi:hypothetical protein
MSDAAKGAPVVSGYQVMAAGFAAMMATLVTSHFGVAGTLLGAALTAMIITGGSAILKGYLEAVTGNVSKVPRKLRARRHRWKAGRVSEPPETTLPTRPDLQDNFAGRMRTAMGWFSHLPPLTRRSILAKGLVAAAVAFVIGMGAVWAVEKGIGNSLSCGIWANCPEGASPGIHPLGTDGSGADSTLSWGRAKTNVAPAGGEVQDPAYRQIPLQLQGPSQQGPSSQRQEPAYHQQPAQPGARPGGGGVIQPDKPAVPSQQVQSSTASPAPEEPAPGGGAGSPSQQGSPSSASPKAPSH